MPDVLAGAESPAVLAGVELPAVLARARQRLECPTPRVALGMALRGIATAAADVSDGLLGDLGHILAQSQVGATINTTAAITLIAACAQPTGADGLFDIKLPSSVLLQCALAGGDDYELVFTAPAALQDAVIVAAQASATPVTRIGHIEAAPGVRLIDATGVPVANTFASFDHFSA